MHEWYDCVEKPLRALVYELRNNGFNTIGSCAHYPHPWIEMEWYKEADPIWLRDLLTRLGYKRWCITTWWAYKGNSGMRIDFDIKNAGIKKGMLKRREILRR